MERQGNGAETTESRQRRILFQFFRSVKHFTYNNVMVLTRILLTLWYGITLTQILL